MTVGEGLNLGFCGMSVGLPCHSEKLCKWNSNILSLISILN